MGNELPFSPTPSTASTATLRRLKGALRASVSDWCRRHERSREQFCDQVSALAGAELDSSKLAHWLEDDDRRIPQIHFFGAMVGVLQDATPLDALLQPAGFQVVAARDVRFLPAAKAFAAAAATLAQESAA